MRRLRRAVALGILSLGLAGCAISAVDMAPDRHDQPWNPATTASGEIVPGERLPLTVPARLRASLQRRGCRGAASAAGRRPAQDLYASRTDRYRANEQSVDADRVERCAQGRVGGRPRAEHLSSEDHGGRRRRLSDRRRRQCGDRNGWPGRG